VRPTTARNTRPAEPITATKKKCLNSAFVSRDWMYIIDAYAKSRKKTPATCQQQYIELQQKLKHSDITGIIQCTKTTTNQEFNQLL